jgi:FKBP-type peptidyl-prolyl cis-trans isomerase FkpA
MPLGETAQTSATEGDVLTVVAGTNTANPAQLGSGQVASKSNGGTTAPASVPGPETFGQYEQYKDGQSALFGDIEVGSGNEAISGKKVAVYYKGWLTNGTLFDQSRPGEDGQLQPFVFTLGAGQVIKGWEQSVAGMKVGGTRRLIIPPSVGYGAQAQGNIPANSVLIFDVQLLAIQ